MPAGIVRRLLRHDRRTLRPVARTVVGVDEAGRGALAGPVTAAAVWLEAGFYDNRALARRYRTLDDSKKLTAPTRAALQTLALEERRDGRLDFEVAEASVPEIDELNILGATKLAMRRALEALAARRRRRLARPGDGRHATLFDLDADPLPAPQVLVDGQPLGGFAYHHRAIVRGDGKSFAIALASVLAKHCRDQRMFALHEGYPLYGFADHKGYGTPQHLEALREHGPSPEHRALFVRSALAHRPHPAQASFEWE